MHTLWFLSVYLVMYLKSSWNQTPHLLALKMAIYAVIVAVIWEIPAVFSAVWSPLTWLLSTEVSLQAGETSFL